MFSGRSAVGGGPNAIWLALQHARGAGRTLADLTVGNPTQADIAYPEAELAAALSDPRALRYEPDSLGLFTARKAVSRHWAAQGLSCPPERLVVTASTSEAYSFLFKLLCDPGDEVLVPAPSYPLFEHLARYEEVRAVPYRLAYDGSWHIDFEDLAEARTASTRAVLLVNPNNPTGHFVSAADVERLRGLGLPLISDEVFAGYGLTGAFASALRGPSLGEGCEGGLTFVLDGLSKWAGLPQLKLGWVGVFGSEENVQHALRRLELIADTYLSVNTPVQVGLPRILECGAQVHVALRERVSSNLTALRSTFSGSAITPLHVEGGWYVTLRLPAVRNEEEWLVGAIQDAGVHAQPGWFYDFEGGPYAVVSLLTPPTTLAAGLRALSAYVSSVLESG